MPSQPTQDDAKLLLELYDLRRERRLRRARDFVQQECKFKDFADFDKKYPEGSKERTSIGMVMGYWDMACTLVENGLLNEELFTATTFEHVGVWFKLKLVAEAYRKKYNYPGIAKALETVASRHPGAGQYAASKPQPAAKARARKRRR